MYNHWLKRIALYSTYWYMASVQCCTTAQPFRKSLINIPNRTCTTCWVDVSLQLLLNIPQIHTFMHTYGPGDSPLQKAYFSFFCDYWTSIQKNDLIDPLQQFIDTLYEEKAFDSKSYPRNIWNDPVPILLINTIWGNERTIYYQREKNIRINNPFFLEIYTFRVCPTCKAKTAEQHNFNPEFLPYPLLTFATIENNSSQTLKDDWQEYCKQCAQDTYRFSITRIETLPDVILTDIKRQKAGRWGDRDIAPQLTLKAYTDAHAKTYTLYGLLIRLNNNHHIALIRFNPQLTKVTTATIYNDFYRCNSIANDHPSVVKKTTMEEYSKTSNDPNTWHKTFALYICDDFTQVTLAKEPASDTSIIRPLLHTLAQEFILLTMLSTHEHFSA